MKYCLITLLSVLLLSFSQTSQAQFFLKIKNHAADVVNKKMDQVVEGSNDNKNANGKVKTAANIDVLFDFKSGDSILFQDDFSQDKIGKFPNYWKTNASGSVVKVPGVSGNWFLLNNDATYKLDSLISMPKNFTVEFDIIASCNEASDLTTLYFGLSRDNNAGDYLGNTGVAGAGLYYMNEDEYYTSSRDLDNHHFGNFNLVNTLNEPLHVSIEVVGTTMKIYLDKTRILNSEMFQPGTRKYFFVSSPLNYSNGGKVLIGNVKITRL